MTIPSNSTVQNILPVQAYFNIDGSFNTFIGQGVPFVVSATESIGITDTTVNGTFYPVFSPVSTGQVTSLDVTSAKFTFNPSTGVLSAPSFSGNVSGTASTASNITGGIASQLVYQTGVNSTGFIPNGISGQFLVSNGTSPPSWTSAPTSSTNVVDDTSSATTFYPLFSSATSGTINTVDTSSTKLQYVPSTGTLKAAVFSGSGASLTNIPNSALTNSSFTLGSTSISLGSTTTVVAGLSSVTSTTFVGALTGNASTATTATTATNATNVAITDNTSSSATWYPTLSANSSGNNLATTSSTKLSFIPSTGVLSATSFSGAGTGLTGTASSLSIGGNASTATNVASGSTNQILYQTGSNATSFITAPTTASTYLQWNGSAFVWASVSGGSGTVTSVTGTSPVNVATGTTTPVISLSSTGSGNVVLATGATLSNPIISNYEAWTSASKPSYTEGLQWYDSTSHSLAYYNDSANAVVHIGQDIQVKVINNTGSTIANGSPVYITSTSSGQTYPNIALAKADVAATSAVIGLTNGSISNGSIGYVTSTGGIDGVNTGAFTVGQVLYLSPYSAGQLMNTIPPTGITVQVGVVSYVDATNGKIYVKQTTPLAVPASIITGTLGVSNGGTGATTLTGYVKGNGTSAFTASSTIPTTDLSGTVTNAQLANSAITINGTSTSLGGSISVGTVTSVGITGGTGISVSGSPITGSGSITVTNSSPMAYPLGTGIAVVTSGSSWGTTLTAPSGTIVGTTDTQTLTNKRVTPRASTTTSSATPTINTDTTDIYGLTAQAVDITSFTTNLSGTPTDGQKLWIYIVGTAARAITWGTSFESSTATLPTTTVTTNRLDVGFVWNTATSKWRCVAVA